MTRRSGQADVSRAAFERGATQPRRIKPGDRRNRDERKAVPLRLAAAAQTDFGLPWQHCRDPGRRFAIAFLREDWIGGPVHSQRTRNDLVDEILKSTTRRAPPQTGPRAIDEGRSCEFRDRDRQFFVVHGRTIGSRLRASYQGSPLGGSSRHLRRDANSGPVAAHGKARFYAEFRI